MATLEKKSNKEFEAQINEQTEHIKQLQKTIEELQAKLTVSEKEKEVQQNLAAEKHKAAAINPQNLHVKLKSSGHPLDVQAQILKNAN